ncbi:MAG: Cna B-type domain-containing protein, partial [Clostridia bacterium]|nr:Cna B-type domain-containing protein [Clostridia bacterium]
DWKCTFTKLPKYEVPTDGYTFVTGDETHDGHIFTYTVEEELPEDYTTDHVRETAKDLLNETDDFKYAITNTIKQRYVNISGEKTWIDGEDEAKVRPASIIIRLWRNDGETGKAEVASVKVTAENGWKWSFDDLPKYAVPALGDEAIDYVDQDGHAFEYWTTEDAIYEKGTDDLLYTTIIDPEDKVIPSLTEANTVAITNTIAQRYIEINGTKKWIDPAGTEHDPITINVIRDDGVTVGTTVLGNGELTYSFTGLPKYAVPSESLKNYPAEKLDGHIIQYIVVEEPVEGYTSKSTSNSVTFDTDFVNTIEQEYLEISGTKTWVAPEDIEHPMIHIILVRDGMEIEQRALLNGRETYTFENLPKYAVPCDELKDYKGELDGHIFNYSVYEMEVEGYESVQDGFDFTNTIKQKYTEVEGTKTWIDPIGTEHAPITIRLYRDGVEIGQTVLKNGELTYKFTELLKYAVACEELTGYEGELDGHEFVYTVTEDAVEGYTSEQDGFNFTNTIEQDYVDISGIKTWIDPVGTEHAVITINLLQDGVEIDETQLADGELTYTFEHLEKYAPDGHIYEYTVTEDPVEGYTTAQNGTDFINTIVQEYVDVNGTKTWDAPEGIAIPEITINLMQDGVEIDEIVLLPGELTFSFEHLEKYAPDGHIYEYTVTEDRLPAYETVVDGYNITNTFRQRWTDIEIIKVWVDNGAVGVEHPTITVRLYRNGEEIASAELPNGVTYYSFDNLPVFDLETGYRFNYTISEDPVEGYETAVNGTTITNTSTGPSYVSITGTKTWIDDGREHDNAAEIVITLTRRIAGGAAEVVTDAQIVWEGNTYSFHNLLEKDENGNEYIYSVTEQPVADYETTYDGYNITNRLLYDVLPIGISGSKYWNDNDNELGKRPESVTVQLFRDGELIDTVTVTAENNWSYTFADLPDNDGYGHYYTYTVGEQLVPGYWLRVEGYDLYNTIIPEEPVPETFRRLREEELEELLEIFDYGVPLWGGLLGTGDEIPTYSIVLASMGLLALAAYIVLNRKGKRT